MTDAELQEIRRNARDCTPGDVYALLNEVERLRKDRDDADDIEALDDTVTEPAVVLVRAEVR